MTDIALVSSQEGVGKRTQDSPSLREGVGGRVFSHLGDALGLLVLVGTFWHMAGFDGGFETATVPLSRVAALAVAAVAVGVAEAARLPLVGRLILAGWGLGALASLVFAAERSGYIHAALIYGLVPMVALAGMRVWRRSWGPAAILLVLLGALGAYWHGAFLAWWGHLLSGNQRPLWLALSWHNQSSMLMGALGLLLLGPALLGRRLVAVGTGLASGMGLAGAWLAASRGGIIATGLGVVVAAAGAVRLGGWRRLLRLAAVLATGVLVVTSLLNLRGAPGLDAQPLAERSEPASTSLALRAAHAEAALGMFASRPVTGYGLGSYRRIAPQFSSPAAHLTSSAHSEPAEALAEGGLAFGIPFLGASLAAAWLVLMALARPERIGRPKSPADVRGPLALGAGAAVGALGLHGAADFDWLYPVLPGLLGLGAGLLAAQTVPIRHTAWRDGLVVVPIVVVLAAGVLGSAWESGSRVPWDATEHISQALALAGQGEHLAAQQILEAGRKWNPGDRRFRFAGAVIDYQSGRLSAEQLALVVEPGRARFADYNLVAGALLDGEDYPQAGAVLDEVLALYPRYGAWRPQEPARVSWALAIRLAGETAGCRAAHQRSDEASRDPMVGDAGGLFDRLAVRYCRAQ
ncbi:MAG: O-antigen ligase family protein [Acidimicrobiia bacterium]